MKKSKLLTKKAKYTPAELAKKYNAIQVSEEAVTLNDDLVHLAVIVSEKGTIPGIMIKDLQGDDAGFVIEKEFCERFIENLRDAWIEVRKMSQDINS